VTERQPFRDEDAHAAWNEAAHAWEDFVESGKDYYRHEIHGPALLAVCEPLAGRRVLDLGCVFRFTTWLTQRSRSEALVAFSRPADRWPSLALIPALTPPTVNGR
jgi:hypothetical protein